MPKACKKAAPCPTKPQHAATPRRNPAGGQPEEHWMNTGKQQAIHPGWLRAMHWLNALAVVVLMMSGWRIYNASAFLGFMIPKDLTLGGWLGGALQWHFAAMWLLFFNGVLYLAFNLFTR